MRAANGDMRNVSNTLETIHAAATAIASAESRGAPPETVQKRRWGSCWSIYWCFGSHRHKKRIGHAVLAPEPVVPESDVPAPQNPGQAPTITLPFVAPPSSPASFLQSESPSAAQSPASLVPLSSVSANVYSPGGPASIFAIGPYAHETQLVSPPVFSTFTTEPSTAPFTPPPESVHLTTPSSPEVPFAQLLDPNLRNGEACQKFPFSHYEFQSYQLYPGSPVGQLISPRSGVSGSGTSSPFPDREFAVSAPHFLQFQAGEPPRLLNLDKLSPREWGSSQGSGTLTPDAVRPKSCDDFPFDKFSAKEGISKKGSATLLSDAALNYQKSWFDSHRNLGNGYQNGQILADHRVSFELTAEDVIRCVEKKPVASAETGRNASAVEREDSPSQISSEDDCRVGVTSNETPEKATADGEERRQYQKHRSLTLGSVKEFNFDNADGADSHRLSIGSDWWTSEKVDGKETVPSKNWSFFPMMQPGVS